MNSHFFASGIAQILRSTSSPLSGLLEKIAAPMPSIGMSHASRSTSGPPAPGGTPTPRVSRRSVRRAGVGAAPIPIQGPSANSSPGRRMPNAAPLPSAVTPQPPGVRAGGSLQGSGASNRLEGPVGVPSRTGAPRVASGTRGGSSATTTKKVLAVRPQRPGTGPGQGAFRTVQTNSSGTRLDSQTGIPIGRGVLSTGVATGADFSGGTAPSHRWRFANPTVTGRVTTPKTAPAQSAAPPPRSYNSLNPDPAFAGNRSSFRPGGLVRY